MSSELAMHAYVFLGNALHLLKSGAAAEAEQELGVSRAELQALEAKVEPMTPKTILEEVAALPGDQRVLLERLGQWWIPRLGPEFGEQMGIDEPEARAVLDWLGGAGG